VTHPGKIKFKLRSLCRERQFFAFVSVRCAANGTGKAARSICLFLDAGDEFLLKLLRMGRCHFG
jgi:hypothetical protein